MPTISTFYGIIIRMFWDDHAPAHFHATYGEHDVLVSIQSLEVMEGELPRRAMRMVMEWADRLIPLGPATI